MERAEELGEGHVGQWAVTYVRGLKLQGSTALLV